MIYTVGMKVLPSRNTSPDIGDIMVVVLPDGGRRYFRSVSGHVGRCSECCPMSRMDVRLPDKPITWNICGYADFACYASKLGYHWEEIPIEAIMEDMI